MITNPGKEGLNGAKVRYDASDPLRAGGRRGMFSYGPSVPLRRTEGRVRAGRAPPPLAARAPRNPCKIGELASKPPPLPAAGKDWIVS